MACGGNDHCCADCTWVCRRNHQPQLLTSTDSDTTLCVCRRPSAPGLDSYMREGLRGSALAVEPLEHRVVAQQAVTHAHEFEAMAQDGRLVHFSYQAQLHPSVRVLSNISTVVGVQVIFASANPIAVQGWVEGGGLCVVTEGRQEVTYTPRPAMWHGLRGSVTRRRTTTSPEFASR